ncbi:MAG: hypothetical protein K2Q26_10035 [Bdellovibrionales bacterium]|nr:hypothetical protein [Bdellovibrionales bacterium]
MSKAKIIGGLVVVLVAVGVKLGLRYGLGWGLAEADVASSKSEKWPEDFKSVFIDSCTNAEEGVDKTFMREYCTCATDKIEAEQIIPTKYNPNTDSPESYDQRVGKIVEDFMSSEKGQRIAEECVKGAQHLVNPADDSGTDAHDH